MADPAGAAASSSDAAACQDDTAVAAGEKDLQVMRKKCKNTLFLAGAIMAHDRVHPLMKMHFAVLEPTFSQHSEQARVQRSPEESLQHYMRQTQGCYMDTLHKTCEVLSQPNKLAFFGLHVDTGDLPPVDVLQQQTAFLAQENTMAVDC